LENVPRDDHSFSPRLAVSKTPKAETADKKPSVIKKTVGTVETQQQRLVKKHIPAWVISGAVHVALIATLILADKLMAKTGTPPSDAQLTVVNDDQDKEEAKQDLTNPDDGLDPDLIAAVPNDNLDTVNVDTKVTSEEPPGVADATNTTKMDFIPPAGLASDINPGAIGDAGGVMAGGGAGGAGIFANEGFNGRNAATKSAMLAAGGGNEASEAAVARGLIWLSKQQKADGSWAFDGARNNGSAATGLALLPFLAAGQTHKVSKDNKYNKNVEGGLRFLIKTQGKEGGFPGGMYAHGIATIALCEALGMSGDRSLLQVPAQRAVNYIQNAQGPNGGWRYAPGQAGDTSVTGWHIQALHSAKLCKELVVDKKVLEKAGKYLDEVSSGSNKSKYGYTGPGGSASMSAVGLLCRYYMDGWGPNHPGMAAGVQDLLKLAPGGAGKYDMYFLYYATQVVHFHEGAEWHKEWNPKMRDMMITKQVPQTKGADAGSWDPDNAHMGTSSGRLGTTCMCLLTLEVYYRHLPLYKRDNKGLKELERVK